MKRYFLFVFGDYNDNSKLQKIVETVSQIATSTYCKFKKNSNSVVVNFASSDCFDDLSEYIKDNIEGVSNYYFLIQQNANMSVNLSEDELAEFLTLEDADIQETHNLEKEEDRIMNTFFEILINTDIPDMEFIEELEEEEEDDYIKKSKKPKFNLDSILDKINQKGINSLTKEEKNYLKTFK